MASREVPTRRQGSIRPVVRDYMIVCVGALLLLTLLLLHEGFGLWSVLPLLVGGVGIVSKWSTAPSLVLFCLLLLLTMRRRLPGIPWRVPEESSFLLDLAMAYLTLVYLVGGMRLLALMRHTVPPDVRRERKPPGPRVHGRWFLPKEATSRSASGVPSDEIVLLMLASPAFVVAAALGWIRLAVEPPPEWLDFPLPVWRAVLLVWGAGIMLAGAYCVLAYMGRTQASGEESLLYLQDQLWTATRGEQRRINRWVAGARLRKQQKEDQA